MINKLVITHNTARYVFLHYRQLILDLVERGIEVVCVVPPESAVAQIEALGARCIPYGVSRRGMNPVSELVTLFSMARIFRRERPDAVFNFSIKPVIYGAFAARLAGVRRVYSMVTGLGYVFMSGGLLQTLVRRLVQLEYRLALALNERVFFQNEDDRNLFVAGGLVTKEKTVVLDGSGVDTTEYVPREKPNTATGTFIMIGRLLRDKGLYEYAAAARELKARYPGARFQILGGFDSNPTAIDPMVLEQWTHEGVVEYLGETEDVRPYLSSADVFVLPSYREGLPRATLEAMAMGKPVITTDAPGCRQTVDDGVNGFIVPVRDSDALRRAMEAFLSEPDLVRTMGVESRRLVVGRFDVRHVVHAILDTVLGRVAAV